MLLLHARNSYRLESRSVDRVCARDISPRRCGRAAPQREESVSRSVTVPEKRIGIWKGRKKQLYKSKI